MSPAAAIPARVEPGSISPDRNRMIGLLREMREECQNLEECLTQMKTIAALPGPEARDALVAASQQSAGIFESNKPRFGERLASARQVMDLNSELMAEFGDAVTEIENRWERVCINWPKGTEASDVLPSRIATVARELNRIVYSCGLRTIPDRVNRNLDALRIGQALDFGKTFVDELPDKEHRDKVLDFLSRHPKQVHGMVEPATGKIYKTSPNVWRQGASFMAFLVALILPVPLIWVYSMMGTWFPGQHLPGAQGDFATLLIAYGAVALGSLVHMGILALKQARSTPEGSLTVLGDWVLWFHVKETPIVVGVLTLWVALVALAWNKQTSAGTAFFVGYSLDSFVDLFLQRFETAAAAATETTKIKFAESGA